MRSPKLAVRIQLLDEAYRVTDTYDTGYFEPAPLVEGSTRDQFYAEVSQALRELADNIGQGQTQWTHLDTELLRTLQAERGIVPCGYCGTTLVEIRGQHPEDRPRQVCPCCLQELVDRIHRDTDPALGGCAAEEST